MRVTPHVGAAYSQRRAADPWVHEIDRDMLSGYIATWLNADDEEHGQAELDERAAMLGMMLRACEGMWIVSDVFPHVHVPPPAPDVPKQVRQQLLAALAPDADPAAFSLAAFSHPASCYRSRFVTLPAHFECRS